jgi:hypothetical protein
MYSSKHDSGKTTALLSTSPWTIERRTLAGQPLCLSYHTMLTSHLFRSDVLEQQPYRSFLMGVTRPLACAKPLIVSIDLFRLPAPQHNLPAVHIATTTLRFNRLQSQFARS